MNPPEDKNTLLEDSEAEKPSGLPSAANVCSVSAAIRMHSGDVEVPGMICGMTDKVEKMIKKVFFECGKCGTINEVHSYHRPRFAYEVPAKPSRPLECVKCGETSGHEYDNTVVNALLIELQNSDAFSDLERLSVILFDDDTNNVSTGEQVILTGSIQKIRKNGRLSPFLFARSIRYQDRKELIMTEHDIQEIKAFTNAKGSVIESLALKFAPSVIGYEHVKKGLLLCAANTGEDSVSRRLRINALLVGETGLDKSALLRASAELVPNSKYTSTLNSSVKSLIAVVAKDEEHYMLRQGPVPAASGAICAINEIGRMHYEDQGAFLDAMQEGKIPFGKYGFNTTLKGSATFVMSANPTNNSSWRDAEKINLNEIPVIMPLLDRFDLFFVFRTIRDKTKITEYAIKKTDPLMMSDALQELEEKNYEFLKKYVLYCKRFHPKLSEEARIMLVEYYCNVAIKFGSPRILDALLRIAHAIARLKQKESIETVDATEAMQFYNVILQQLSEVVTIPNNPNDLAIEEITNLLSVSSVPYDFTVLVKEVCKRNELVARYIGDNFSVEKNKKLRRLRDVFKEGRDNRILIVRLKPLVLAWCSSDDKNIGNQILHSTDLTDPTDQEKMEIMSKDNIRNHNADGSGGSDRSDRSVGYAISIADSSKRALNLEVGLFGCYYCREPFCSDLERLRHREHEHPGKLDYPNPEDFENRLNPNK